MDTRSSIDRRVAKSDNVGWRRGRRRGAALLIVMVVVAVAAVMGFAMMSASSLQAQASGNLRYVTSAEYLAESGGQLAMYYLQNPTASPVAMPSGYYPGQTGLTFGATVNGTADVTVGYDSTSGVYTITSVGKATTDGGATISKTLTATVWIVREFKQQCALQTSANVRLPSGTGVTGGLKTNGQLNAAFGSSVSGQAKIRSFTGTGSVPSKSFLTASETVTVPAASTIKNYNGTYTYNGGTYSAQKLTGDTLQNVTLPTASDQLTNPAGIYWYNGSVLLNGNVTINGTLYLTKGTVYAANTGNTVTPKTGFPAIVAPGNMTMVSQGRLTANGLVWVGGGINKYTSSGSDSNASSGLLNALGDLLGAILGLLGGGGSGPAPGPLVVNGGFLAAGSPPIELTYAGSLSFNYDSSKVAVPDFSTANTVITGIRVLTWSMS